MEDHILKARLKILAYLQSHSLDHSASANNIIFLFKIRVNELKNFHFVKDKPFHVLYFCSS